MAPPKVDIRLTWGARLIGYMLDAILYGALQILVLQYFKRYGKRDNMASKVVVGLVSLFTTVEIISLSQQIYTVYVPGLVADLDILPFPNLIHLVANYLTALTAQLYMASRIWILSHGNVFLTAPVALISVASFGLGLAQAISIGKIGRFSLALRVKYNVWQSGFTAGCDVLITTILCLRLHSSRSGLQKTNSIIDKLILYAINRGAITTIVAILNLILYAALNNTFLFMIFYFPSPPLYGLSVLGLLLSRDSLRTQMSSISTGPMTTEDRPATVAHVSRGVRVEKSVVTWDGDNRQLELNDLGTGKDLEAYGR